MIAVEFEVRGEPAFGVVILGLSGEAAFIPLGADVRRNDLDFMRAAEEAGRRAFEDLSRATWHRRQKAKGAAT